MTQHRPTSGRRALVRLAVGGALVAALPALAAAQDRVYEPDELTVKPRVASMTRTAQVVQRSYPEKLRTAGVDGTVQVQFVVGTDGKVENGSVEVVAATVPALADAAREAAAKIEFRPGKVKDAPVRTRVLLPIVYRSR